MPSRFWASLAVVIAITWAFVLFPGHMVSAAVPAIIVAGIAAAVMLI